MNRLEAIEAMQNGHKVAHMYFTDDEYLHMVAGIITSEDGYDFRDWMENLTDKTEWRDTGWRIVKVCCECGKHVYPQDEFTLDNINYAHNECVRG